MGIYNAAYKVLENISFFPAMFVGLVMPIMSRYIFHEPAKFRKIADNTFKVFLILTVPLVIGTVFLAKNIISLIGGSGFGESVFVLQVLSFAMAFIFFGNFFTNVIIAGNQQRKLIAILSFCAALNVGANLVLIPKLSYNGAALTSSITEFMVAALSAIACWKLLRYAPSFEKFFSILASGAVMGIVLYISASLGFIVRAFASLGLYFLLLWAFKAVSTDEMRSLVSRKGGPLHEPEIMA